MRYARQRREATSSTQCRFFFFNLFLKKQKQMTHCCSAILGLGLHRKLTLHEMEARRCHQVRTDSVSGMGFLDLVEVHSWHFAARDATQNGHAADSSPLRGTASCSPSAISKSTARSHADPWKQAHGGTLGVSSESRSWLSWSGARSCHERFTRIARRRWSSLPCS